MARLRWRPVRGVAPGQGGRPGAARTGLEDRSRFQGDGRGLPDSAATGWSRTSGCEAEPPPRPTTASGREPRGLRPAGPGPPRADSRGGPPADRLEARPEGRSRGPRASSSNSGSSRSPTRRQVHFVNFLPPPGELHPRRRFRLLPAQLGDYRGAQAGPRESLGANSERASPFFRCFFRNRSQNVGDFPPRDPS